MSGKTYKYTHYKITGPELNELTGLPKCYVGTTRMEQELTHIGRLNSMWRKKWRKAINTNDCAPILNAIRKFCDKKLWHIDIIHMHDKMTDNQAYELENELVKLYHAFEDQGGYTCKSSGPKNTSNNFRKRRSDGNNWNSKKVIDIITGKEFDSAKSAAEYYKYNKSNLINHLNGSRKVKRYYHLKYLF